MKRLTIALVALIGVTLAACGSSSSGSSTTKPPVTTTTVPPTTTTTTSIAEVGALINTLYYNVSQAYANSPALGFEAVLAGDYPGSIDSAKFQACVASGVRNATYTETEVPNLTTLALDPKWTLPAATTNQPYWIPQSAPPVGTTYILQVGITYAGGNSSNLVHVTILNGKPYFYEGPYC